MDEFLARRHEEEASVRDRQALQHGRAEAEWRVRQRDPAVVFVPYEQVYPHGVEEMFQRVPSTDGIRAELGWEPTVDLDGILAEVIEHARRESRPGVGVRLTERAGE